MLIIRNLIAVAALITAADPNAVVAPRWETVPVGGGVIATPKGWRSLDNIQPNLILYRQGDGIGVPAIDETGAPVQVGLIVVKMPPTEQSVRQVVDNIAEGAKHAPNLVLLRPGIVENIRLSDGTEATLLRLEFFKEEDRRSLQMKLIAKDKNSTVWIVSGTLVGGKESRLPTPESAVAMWLAAHMASLTFDPGKLDADKLNRAYDALSAATVRKPNRAEPIRP